MTKKEAAIEYALSFLGLPYLWGGDSPFKGFDCSGLVQEILMGVGLDPSGDQTAQGLFLAFKHKISRTPAEGCLVFFGKDISHITHIGFCVSDGVMVEAGGGGSKTTTRDAAVSANARVRMRSVASRADLVAIVDPFG